VDSTVSPGDDDHQVRHHLRLTNVRCELDGGGGTLAAVAMLQLVFTNDGQHDIEYRMESVRVEIQDRTAELAGERAKIVAPGEVAVEWCPAVRGVDRSGPSSGNIEYVVVYGHPSAPPSERFRRQHGVWFRYEPVGTGRLQLRFVERYDEDDPLI
jgi:hypothetical protein